MKHCKYFTVSDKTFEGKYKRAIELEKHYQRLHEIRRNKSSIDNNRRNGLRFNRRKYKNESMKLKLTNQQRDNLLLYHRLNFIKNNSGHISQLINKQNKSTFNFNKLNKRIKKESVQRRNKRIKLENEITRNHIRNMLPSDDIRIDLLKQHWRKHLNRKKIFKTMNERKKMKPREVKRAMDRVTDRIARKLGYNDKNKENKKTTVFIPKINTKNINSQINKPKTTSRIRRKNKSHKIPEAFSARQSYLVPSQLISATEDQIIAHTNYLKQKVKKRKKSKSILEDTNSINYYLDTVDTFQNKPTRRIPRSSSVKEISRSSFLYQISER